MKKILKRLNKQILTILLGVLLLFNLTSCGTMDNNNLETTSTEFNNVVDSGEITYKSKETSKIDGSSEKSTTTEKVTTTEKQTTIYLELVWIPMNGSKYHKRSSCSNMKKPRQVTIDEAEDLGYEPCKKCY